MAQARAMDRVPFCNYAAENVVLERRRDPPSL
jgi:hypothetical protein